MQTLIFILKTKSFHKYIDIAMLILRLVVGAFMLTHGYGKFLSLIGDDPIQFADPLGIGATASLTLAVLSEFFCSILIIIGLGTRIATIPLIITMFVAAFIVHLNHGFGKQELALLYSAIYIAIAIIGPGKYSIDYYITNK